MDPNELLATIINPDSDSKAVNKALKYLSTWLNHDGFAPRVQSHPATVAWMRGDRYGAVIKVGHKYLHVIMDRSGYVIKFLPCNLVAIDRFPSSKEI